MINGTRRIVNKYGAIACGEKCYRVARMHPNGNWVPVFDIREFTNFEEADRIAKECANGEHNQYGGQYINMR